MKRSLSELIGYSVKAKDGEKGKVIDFLFDEKSWMIRYADVDLGNFFSEKRVLIPRMFLGEPEWENKHFPIDLTVESIKASPDLSFDMPVSRKYEQELMDHYEVHPYWMMNTPAYAGHGTIFYPGAFFKAPRKVVKEENIDSDLRSFNEIVGYAIGATDETFGHVTDLIIDDDDWQVLYLVADTKDILPWSKKVMLPIDLIDEISFVKHQAAFELTKESIKNAPEFDPSEPVNAEYEEVMYDYYGRKK
jgi:sporulation protein YlmC with PRC-barrel domain